MFNRRIALIGQSTLGAIAASPVKHLLLARQRLRRLIFSIKDNQSQCMNDIFFGLARLILMSAFR